MDSNTLTILLVVVGVIITCMYEVTTMKRLYPEKFKKRKATRREKQSMDSLMEEFSRMQAEFEKENGPLKPDPGAPTGTETLANDRKIAEYAIKKRHEATKNARTDVNLEDDNHDWLAEQLGDEKKSYREVSEMFDAKMSHMKNCEAENLKLDHKLHCDADSVAKKSRK